MRIVICTGGYDPIHSGHIAYFKAAKALGDKLIVGLNSDQWLIRKKGQAFLPLQERFAIVSALGVVDEVLVYNDDDNSSCDAIRLAKLRYPNDTLIFANGGDRNKDNIPEMIFDDVEFAFGVGGNNKINSSSWLLQEWKAPKTDRNWGYYRVLHTVGSKVKLKELTVNPKTCLSMQRHAERSEFWFVAQGTASIYTLDSSTDRELTSELQAHESTFIKLNEWHQLCNETDFPLKLIEIQYGDTCIEEDIQRH